jgi:hypothetical protein
VHGAPGPETGSGGAGDLSQMPHSVYGARTGRQGGFAVPAPGLPPNGTRQHGRSVMAKGQMRSTKEKKKPKAEWNKKKKGGPAPSPFALTQARSKPDPFAKKP